MWISYIVKGLETPPPVQRRIPYCAAGAPWETSDTGASAFVVKSQPSLYFLVYCEKLQSNRFGTAVFQWMEALATFSVNKKARTNKPETPNPNTLEC